MENAVFEESTNNTILNQVHEGMRVCDNAGNEIGAVHQVFLGAVSDKRDERGFLIQSGVTKR